MANLVIAEHDHNGLKAATLNVISAAAAIGGDIHVLVAGSNAANAAAAAAKVAGVSKVLHADGAAHANLMPENAAAQVVAAAGGYSHLLFPATAYGKGVAPRVAALLDKAQVSDVIKVIDADTFVRPIYAGNAYATVKSSDSVKVITVRGTAFAAAASSGGAALVEAVACVNDAGLASFVSAEITKSERPELTAAKIVVTGGRGLGSGENYQKVIVPLADKLNAALGASRAAVDAGYVPNDYQVGQTGKIVAPELYVAIGVSGAIQHLAGMKDSKTIIAINKDPDAPIFSVADYGLVADLFEAVPELTAKL
jgi:electron transfer flavoprotein alpha subunit